MNKEEARQNEIRDRLLNALEWLEEIKGSTSSDENYENADIIQKFINCYQTEINRQKAEIERLQTRVGELIRQYNNDIEKVESRVIQDFAKKLKKRFKGFPMYNYSEINNEIDTLVHFYPCIKKITAIKHDSLCETETYKGGE